MNNSKLIKVHRFLSVLKRDVIEAPFRVLYLFFSAFPIKQNKIMIDYPYHRETIAVVDRLLLERRGLDIVIAGNPQNDERVRYVKPNTLKYIYELATSSVWIDSIRKSNWVKKRSRQLYIQTWHGAVAMKKVEKDAQAVLSGAYVKRAINDSRMADFIVAETKQFEKTVRQSFWYDGPILRGEFKDGVLDPINRKKVCEELGIEENYQVVLYAPTFRSDGNMECYDMDYQNVIKALEQKTNKKWIIIIRLHPVVGDKCTNIQFSKQVINGTYYPKLGDLISLSNILITDYSSCMFYGYRSLKPVFIYASDFDEYMTNDRGGYFKYEDLPAPVAKTTEELVSKIMSFDREKYKQEVIRLNKTIGYYENDVMDLIIEEINKHVRSAENVHE